MPRAVLAVTLFATLAVLAATQEAKSADPAPLQLTAQQDHKLMMQALGIESLRPGADGMNPNAPNAANYDESKANPYPNLPDPLVLKNGEKVTTAEQWWKQRRREIVEDFDREVYGRIPKDVPKVNWEVAGATEEEVGDVAVVTKRLLGLCNKGLPRKPEDWGALRAWAWGTSRALDYFETDPAVDAKQVGIEGLSRYGKAALVAMAYDQRFAIGFIGSSGEGGAKLHRRNFGELVENLTGSGEYHWMAGSFLKYGGPLTPGDLPVDAHELMAMCAPRPTFISYGASTGPGAEGQWVDQRGSFMAAVAAGPVYKLLGKKDLGTALFPEVETGLMDGELAFRQHRGGHTTGPNWPTFLAFADRYIKVSPASATSRR